MRFAAVPGVWCRGPRPNAWARPKGGLNKRLLQFRRHVYGKRSPHRGGQAILLLDCQKIVRWAEVADDAGAEHRLLEIFKQLAGRYPFGNRMRSAKSRR